MAKKNSGPAPARQAQVSNQLNEKDAEIESLREQLGRAKQAEEQALKYGRILEQKVKELESR